MRAPMRCCSAIFLPLRGNFSHDEPAKPLLIIQDESDPQDPRTGSATLTLYDVPADPVVTIAPGGSSASATTSVPGQNAIARFQGSAGRRVSLTLGATGLALEIDLGEPIAMSPTPVRRRRVSQSVVSEDVDALLFTPTRPGRVLAAAAERHLPVG